ncbi:MAG: hypothetical protein AAGG48_02890 [Planctomycetota bacterium]
MNADDFQELYKLLRGSKSAMPVLDAKALYSDRKMVAALDRLTYARETFLESRSRLLKQDVEKQVDKKAKDADRQIKKLKRKQDKLIEIAKAFDELLEHVEKLAVRERERQAKAAEVAKEEQALAERQERSDQLKANVARREDITKDFAKQFSKADDDGRLDLVAERFGFEAVESEDDLLGDSLYLIRTGEKSYLVSTPSSETMEESIAVEDVVQDRPIRPFPRDEFLKLGTRRKMVLLIKRSEDATESGSEVEDAPPSSGAESGSDPDSTDSTDQKVLDMGAFSQLLSSAQRCGLISNADQIGHVRDREFRKGHYDRAFQTIDGMYRQLMSSAGQRTQQLMREDADISSGRIKISPKELQAKRARERAQTQEIERAKRRFQVVLEGLRVLMNRKPAVAT